MKTELNNCKQTKMQTSMNRLMSSVFIKKKKNRMCNKENNLIPIQFSLAISFNF